MINEKYIYTHLKNGGNPETLHQEFLNELNEVQKIVDEEKAAEQEVAKKEAGIKEARQVAITALTEYFALVNPDITEKMITSVLSTLESVKIAVKSERGARSKTSIFDDWADIMSLILR